MLFGSRRYFYSVCSAAYPRRFIFGLCLASGLLGAASVQSQSTSAATAHSAWRWPVSGAQAARVRDEALALAQRKHAGQQVSIGAAGVASFPSLSWFWKRYGAAGSDAPVVYRLVHEDLMWANRMLASERPDLRERGLRVAHYAALRAGIALGDSHLRALIYAGWILPRLDAGAEGSTRDISRQRLVEAAYDAFRRDGQRENQKLALRLLVRYSDRQNTRDWARVKLAEALATEDDYAGAVAQMERVQSPEMAGSRALLDKWRAQARAQTAARAAAKSPRS